MKKSLILLAAAAMALVGCNKQASVPAGQPGDVKFTSNIQVYTLKATDTAFENGDKIGIFAGAPIGKDNVQAVVSGTSLNHNSAIKWKDGDNSIVKFYAYYPYVANATKNLAFAVQANQNNGGYKKSDLMLASAQSAQTENAVALNFKHALSKVAIGVVNNFTDATVKNVVVEGVALEVGVNLETGALSPADVLPGNITARVIPGGYELILVPQTASPKIRVSLSNGKEYVFELKGSFEFKAGKKATASLTVDPQAEANAVLFSLDVADWGEDDSPLAFNDPTIEDGAVWQVVGTIGGKTWENPAIINMEENEYGDLEADITYAQGEEFKLHCGDVWAGINAQWDTEIYGIGVFSDSNNYLSVADDAKNIKLQEAGEYHLYFDPENNWFVVTKNGGEDPQLEPQTAKLTVNVFNQPAWENIYLWCWDDDANYTGGNWPGIAPAAEDVVVNNITYKSFVIAEYPVGVITNFILSNGAGAQTADIAAPGAITKDSEVYVWLKSDFSVAFIADPTNFEPGEPAPEVWNIVGSFNNWTDGDVMTVCTDDENAVEVEFTYSANDNGFKFKVSGGWNKYYGPSEVGNDNAAINLAAEYTQLYLNGGGNLTIEPGTYKAKLVINGDNAGKLYIIPADKE